MPTRRPYRGPPVDGCPRCAAGAGHTIAAHANALLDAALRHAEAALYEGAAAGLPRPVVESVLAAREALAEAVAYLRSLG